MTIEAGRRGGARAAALAGIAAAALAGALVAQAGGAPRQDDPAAAPADAPAAKREWKVEPIAAEAGKSALPSELPEAFAKLLAEPGLRVLGPDGKVRAELWFRRELPLLAKEAGEGGVRLARLAAGTFVGALRAPGRTADYRDLEIDPGVYALRYSWQPSDGNHLGTSDSRDFFVLTSLAQERSPEPVADPAALVELAVAASPSEHALVLYVAPASGPAPADGAARVVRRGELDEWALEVALPARAPDAGKPDALRVALVVEGHTAH